MLRKRCSDHAAIFSLTVAIAFLSIPALAETLDFAFHPADRPYGEATASVEAGGVVFSAT